MPGWNGLERRAHWLRKNRKSKRPPAILFLSIETTTHYSSDDQREHTFRLGAGAFCLYHESGGLLEQEWRDLDWDGALWEWICELTKDYDDLLIIALDMDLVVRVTKALVYLPRMNWKPTYFIPANTCRLYEWKKNKCTLSLVDNKNWWNATLESLGESTGLPELSVDPETVEDVELAAHCRRDVAILVRLWREWIQFLDKENLGDFGITISTQAFNAYRHRFMPCKIGIHNHSTVMDLERESYYGGRNECLQIGKLPPGPYYKLDINSLYPAMMKWYPYPRKRDGLLQNVPVSELQDLLSDRCVIAQVALHTDAPLYPYRLNKRNCYPVGDFLATLTTPELEIALARGDVKGVGWVALYEPAKLFEDYVDFFYSLRQKHSAGGNQVQALICKMFLNSLQGKFGQRGYSQKVIGEAPLDKVDVFRVWDIDEGKHVTVYTYGGKIIEESRSGEPFNSSPAIPAHVAAYARVYMWSLIQKAGIEHVYYIDTDCLFVDQIGYGRLTGVIDPHKLGSFKVEGIATDVEIRAKKDYRFGERCVRKGIKDSAVQLAEDLFEQWHVFGLSWVFQSGSLGTAGEYKVRKRLRYDSLAGQIQENGRVSPPRLRLTPKRLQQYLADYQVDRHWIWEFDPAWLESLHDDEPAIQLVDPQDVVDPETGQLVSTSRLFPVPA